MKNQTVYLVTFHWNEVARALVINKKNIVGICDTPGQAVTMARRITFSYIGYSRTCDAYITVEAYTLNEYVVRGTDRSCPLLFKRMPREKPLPGEGQEGVYAQATEVTEENMEEQWFDAGFRAQAEKELASS